MNCSLKVSDVQSSPGSAMIFSSDGGSGVGCFIACEFKEKNDERLFLDKWSAMVLAMPAICVDVISIS